MKKVIVWLCIITICIVGIAGFNKLIFLNKVLSEVEQLYAPIVENTFIRINEQDYVFEYVQAEIPEEANKYWFDHSPTSIIVYYNVYENNITQENLVSKTYYRPEMSIDRNTKELNYYRTKQEAIEEFNKEYLMWWYRKWINPMDKLAIYSYEENRVLPQKDVKGILRTQIQDDDWNVVEVRENNFFIELDKENIDKTQVRITVFENK